MHGHEAEDDNVSKDDASHSGKAVEAGEGNLPEPLPCEPWLTGFRKGKEIGSGKPVVVEIQSPARMCQPVSASTSMLATPPIKQNSRTAGARKAKSLREGKHRMKRFRSFIVQAPIYMNFDFRRRPCDGK